MYQHTIVLRACYESTDVDTLMMIQMMKMDGFLPVNDKSNANSGRDNLPVRY